VSIRSLLAERLPGLRASDSLADRTVYARDSWQRSLVELGEGRLPGGGRTPGAVCWPKSTEDVAATVELGRREGLELVPFGAGSGVCGGIAGGERTLVVDLKHMGEHAIAPDRSRLSVGPGATGITLENELQQRGCTIGHFPSSILCSTVGGWVAARGAGQCSSRYGKVEDMLLGAECVLGSGRVVHFQRRRGGLDLLPLIVGSEGALGFVTRAELRLHELPLERRFAAFRFGSGRAGMAALRRLAQENLRPSVARLYDALDTLLMRRSSHEKRHAARGVESGGLARLRKRAIQKLLSRAPLLNRGVDLLERSPFGDWLMLLVFEGAGAGDDALRARRILQREGGQDAGEEPARRWYDHRYSVSFSQMPVFRAGAFDDTMEVAAPWSHFEGMFDAVRNALARHVLVLAHISHIYPDGCSVYFTFGSGPRQDASLLSIYDAAWRDALAAAQEAGGTISHHHGVGRSKAHALERELGAGSSVLRQVLGAWDPSRIMNPGAVLPREPAIGLAPRVYPEPGLDELSQLVTVEANETLGALETKVREHGLTLNASAAPELSVGEWLARGLPGASDPFADPSDHTLAGFQARLADGRSLALLPVPRRATGPDLTALIVGGAGRIAQVTRATLRVRPLSAPPVRPLPFIGERDPAVSASEAAAWAELCAAFS
jgi:alkyldihydroxyacetonephosphate synthase